MNDEIDQTMEDTPSRLDQMRLTIDEVALSSRVYNALRGSNISQIGDICSMSEAELLRIANFGRKSLNEVKDVLKSMNLELSTGTHVVEPRSGMPVGCVITFCGSPRMEANLKAAAADRGWSIEKEAEYRLTRSFDVAAERAELRRIIREELLTQDVTEPGKFPTSVPDLSRLYC